MTPITLQPTFTVDLPVNGDQAVAKLRTVIETTYLQDHVVTAGKCFDFQIESTAQRFWSPHLSIQVSHRSEGEGCQLFGRFSPRPEIWTMFMAIYGVVLIVMFAAAIFGYVQWAMETTPWALAILPIGLVLIVSLHLGSLTGQRLSADQMHLLRSRLDEAISLAFPAR